MTESNQDWRTSAVSIEEVILGTILLDYRKLLELKEAVNKDNFIDKRSQLIWKAISTILMKGFLPDLSVVTTELEQMGELDTVGGPAYLAHLSQVAIGTTQLDYYVKIFNENGVRYHSGNATHKALRDLQDPTKDPQAVMQEVIAAYNKAGGMANNNRMQKFDVVLVTLATQTEFLRNNPDAQIGVPSGYTVLDNLLGGFQKSDLLILAARPGMGKTALMLNIAIHASRSRGRVAFFSLEMSNVQLAQRIVASDTGINTQLMRTGKIPDNEWAIFLQSIERLKSQNLYMDDTPSITLSHLKSRCQSLQREGGLDLVLIDYLQLMGSERAENRVQEISVLSRGLKELARELNIPVIAGAQLSRAVEQRSDKHPILSDLRESGCLSGDSLLPLADTGNVVPLRDLVGQKNFAVWSLNPQSSLLERAIVSNAFYTGIKPVYHLQLRSGKQLRATGNHPFFTPQGWQRLDALHAGEVLAVPRQAIGPYTSVLSPLDMAWEPIERIEAAGEEAVFDLTVPGLSNFCINQIISHNSLEQDADIVIFIYRDIVYNADSERPYDADLLISKHRNGPTGTVTLAYEAELTKFHNHNVMNVRLDDY